MSAQQFDFDSLVDRRDSGSYKWDDYSSDSDDTIEMWVADMDFRTAPAVLDALSRRVEHGIFGYTYVGDDYYDALTSWFERRHAYRIDRKRVIYTSGVVPAISAIIKALARPGEGVIVNTPAYNCFFSSIRNNSCRIVAIPLRRVDISDTEFTYEFDFEILEQLAAEPSNTLMLLCNPHNPSGRIWSEEELHRVADICRRHGVRVVSDEIHCELAMPGRRYVPYGNIDSSAIICNSPSKAFNTAGLQIANIICPDGETRAAIDRAININEVCDVNPFGVEGLKAAYFHGEEWLDALRAYLEGNYLFTKEFFANELPGYPITRLEATYLLWVDIRRSGLDGDAVERELLQRQHVRVNSGSIYGGDGYIRLNLAMPRIVLAEGLKRIAAGLKSI